MSLEGQFLGWLKAMKDHTAAKSSAPAASLVLCISDLAAADLAKNCAVGWADPTLGMVI